jgi:predicted dithiol-disulfide oxidoreductase (DUF899 family)
MFVSHLMRLPTHPVVSNSYPPVVDRTEWQTRLDELLGREKAHTHEGDAIAAERRRLPMTRVPDDATIVGPNGIVPFIEAFEGRRMLAVYFHMWHDGQPWEGQCEGCTVISAHIQRPAAYLNERDLTLAIFCEGTYDESAPYAAFLEYRTTWWSARDSAVVAGRPFGFYAFYVRNEADEIFETYWTTGRGTELALWSYDLLDRSVFGRQEAWQDAPDGWPPVAASDGSRGADGHQWRTQGRPTAQWEVTDEPAGPAGS